MRLGRRTFGSHPKCLAALVSAFALFLLPDVGGARAQSLFDQIESHQKDAETAPKHGNSDAVDCTQNLFAFIGKPCGVPGKPEAPTSESSVNKETSPGVITLPDVTTLYPFAVTLSERKARLELRSFDDPNIRFRDVLTRHRFKDRTRFVIRAPTKSGAYGLFKNSELYARVNVVDPGTVVLAPPVVDVCDNTFTFRFRGPRVRGDRIILKRQDGGDALQALTAPIETHIHLPASQRMPVPKSPGAYDLIYETHDGIFFAHPLTVKAGGPCAEKASRGPKLLPPGGLEALMEKRRGVGSFVTLGERYGFDPTMDDVTPRIALDRTTLAVCEPINVTWSGPASLKNRFAGSSFLSEQDGVRSLALGPLSSLDYGPYSDGQDVFAGVETVTLYAPPYTGEFEIRYLDFPGDPDDPTGAIFLAVEPITVTPGDPSACETMKDLRRVRNAAMAEWIKANGARIEE